MKHHLTILPIQWFVGERNLTSHVAEKMQRLRLKMSQEKKKHP
jgi:hypothetical protein